MELSDIERVFLLLSLSGCDQFSLDHQVSRIFWTINISNKLNKVFSLNGNYKKFVCERNYFLILKIFQYRFQDITLFFDFLEKETSILHPIIISFFSFLKLTFKSDFIISSLYFIMPNAICLFFRNRLYRLIPKIFIWMVFYKCFFKIHKTKQQNFH